MTDIFYETLENAKITAHLVEHDVYLRKRGGGWFLTDDKPTVPFYIISPNGDAVEVIK